jgi:hypothetical protein
MIDKNKIAILLTTHCDNENRMFMTEKVSERLNKTGYYFCVVSHTPVNEQILKNCNAFVYDSDNSFLVDGQRKAQGHAVAELKSIHDGINYLETKGFTHIFKTCYDINPSLDFESLIEGYANKDKKCVATQWTNNLNTLTFFSEIDFLRKTYNYDELRKYNVMIETMWFLSIQNKGLLGDVFCYPGPEDNQLINISQNEKVHFSVHGGGLLMNEYKEKV